MTARPARQLLGLLIAATLLAAAPSALALDLAIPYGYLNHSGGFFVVGCGQRACLRFAPAGGCAGAVNYPAAAYFNYDAAQAHSGTTSWYAAGAPAHGNPRGRHPGAPPAAAQPKSIEAWEDVGPGLPFEAP